MKEKPILFNTEMVKAVLNGRKTQTRRVVKPQPDTSLWKPEALAKEKEWRYMPCLGPGHHIEDNIWGLYNKDDDGKAMPYVGNKCPYGAPGDRLWVREAWNNYANDIPLGYILYKADMPMHWDAEDTEHGDDVDLKAEDFKWKPSIHMFREDSRINLEITNIRVERVQDITDDDARAEGMTNDDDPHWRPSYSDPDSGGNPSYKNTFCCVWDSINFKRGYGWSVNPWVWVVEFKRI